MRNKTVGSYELQRMPVESLRTCYVRGIKGSKLTLRFDESIAFFKRRRNAGIQSMIRKKLQQYAMRFRCTTKND
jgi:hypothetical protein